jgi:hypothetical protein
MDAWPVWNYADGQKIRVVCYTNAAKAKLLLNGAEVGTTKNQDDNTGIIGWDIPYAAGILEVVGMDTNGNKICNYVLSTSGRPHALTLDLEHNSLADGEGLLQISVRVVDEQWFPVFLSDDEITCTIEGPARLLGLEASNNSDMSNYRDNVHRAYHGRMIAYIQATGETGDITIRFTSPWLEPAEMKFGN